DAGEAQNLERSRVLVIPFDAEHRDGSRVIAFARRKKVWLHIDLDVVDPRELPAVVFPAPGGVPFASLADLVGQLVVTADVRGFEICGYDPRQDEGRRFPARIGGMFSSLAPRAPRAVAV